METGPEEMPVDSSSTDTVVAATETSAQHLDVTKAAVANPCIAVARTAPQRHYKEITTYGKDKDVVHRCPK